MNEKDIEKKKIDNIELGCVFLSIGIIFMVDYYFNLNLTPAISLAVSFGGAMLLIASFWGDKK